MSRRLAALRVGNFKAFADAQRIPLKAITLIFGPNSAGKSSVIHSLALAHEAQFGREKRGRARLDVHHTDVGGNAIDLGGFRQYVHRAQANKRVEWGAELDVSSLDGRLGQLLAAVKTISIVVAIGIELDDQDRPREGAQPRVEFVDIAGDGDELMHMSRRAADAHGSVLRLDRLALDHPVFRHLQKAIIESATTSEEMRPEDYTSAGDAIASLLPQLQVRIERFFPNAVTLPGADDGEVTRTPSLFPISKGNRSADIAEAIRFYLPRSLGEIIKLLFEVLEEELKLLQYLGPLRSFPPRHIAFAESEDSNWYAGGGYAWDVVRRDTEVRDAVNRWLGSEKLKTRYAIQVRQLIPFDQLEAPLESAEESLVTGNDGTQERSTPFVRLRRELNEQISRFLDDKSEATLALERERDMLERQLQARERLLNSMKHEEGTHRNQFQTLTDRLAVLHSRRDDLVRRLRDSPSLAGRQEELRHVEHEITVLRDKLARAGTSDDLQLLEHEGGTGEKREGQAKATASASSEAKQFEELRVRLAQIQHHIENARATKERQLNELARAEDAINKLNELGPLDASVESRATVNDDERQRVSSVMLESIRKANIDGIAELVLLDQRTDTVVSHRDVGIGISQVLPVLVMAYGSKGKLLAMEQPEIHLHPALQAELGDVFIQSALGERRNSLILETHSEHLILRLLKRLRDTVEHKLPSDIPPITPSDLSIIYVRPGSRGSEVTVIEVTNDGEFAGDWPDGFFAERINELM